MKKRVIVLLILIFTFVCSLTACGETEQDSKKENEKTIEAIVVNGGNEVTSDEFDFDSSTFLIKYSDQTTEEVDSSQVKISEDDYEKLFEVGVHKVTLTVGSESVESEIAICASEDEIAVPTTSCYLISKTHYENGVHYTSFYLGGSQKSEFYAFQFKLNYKKDEVQSIAITKASNYGDELEINDNGERISVNCVSGKALTNEGEIFRITYESETMYKNFILDNQADNGFYRLTNDNVYVLNVTFNFNW